MHDIITKKIGRHYESIPNMKFPIIYHPNSTVMSVSDNVVFKMCADGSYSTDVINLVAYIKDVRFATLDQINRAFPNNKFSIRQLMDLVDDFILNAIVLGDREDFEVFKNEDALIIFALDVGGTYILNYAGLDSNKWSLKESHQSTRVIKKLLAQGEYYLKIYNNSRFEMRSFIPRRKFSVGRTITEVDFSMSINNNSIVKNILGYIVEDGFEDLNFRTSISDLSEVFNETQAWKKDYPISEKPTVVLIVYSKESLMKVSKIMTESTSYSPVDVNIILYNHLIDVDIDDLSVFSYVVKEDGAIKIGKLPKHALS